MTMNRNLLVAMLSLALAAPAAAQSKDVEGSKDSPLVSRYPGSVIDNYKTRQFDEFNFPIGSMTSQGTPKSLHLEVKSPGSNTPFLRTARPWRSTATMRAP